jgi:hypothetical protein
MVLAGPAADLANGTACAFPRLRAQCEGQGPRSWRHSPRSAMDGEVSAAVGRLGFLDLSA